MLIGPGGQSSTLEQLNRSWRWPLYGTSNNSDANQFISSPIATSPLYTKKYVNSHRYPHGEGCMGETWGKFAVPMVGGGGNMGEVHPRSAPPVGQSMPHPAQGGASLIGALQKGN